MSKKITTSKLSALLFIVVIGIIAISIQLLPRVAAWSSVTRTPAKPLQQKKGGMKAEISIALSAANNPRISMADGREVVTEYTGAQQAVEGLRNQQAEPLALVADDFDRDGVKDIVAAYTAAGRGLLALQYGNVDWLQPYSTAAKARKQAGEFTDAPFLPEARVFEIAEIPDFIGAGDFNADGKRDLVVASRRNTALTFLPGDGKGNFLPEVRVELPGFVTALRCGDVNRRDGLQDVVVGVWSGEGAKAMVFESRLGAMKATPEIFAMPTQVSDLLIEKLDGDYLIDIAVAAGKDFLIIGGRDRKLALGIDQQTEVEPATITRKRFSSAIRSLTFGDFNAEQGREVALLTADGSIEIVARTDGAGATAVFSTRTLATGIYPTATQVISSRVSDEISNNLAVLDGAARQLHLISSGIRNEGRKKTRGGLQYDAASVAELNLNEEPIAVLPMRLNADPLSDFVVLRRGQSAITVAPSAPQATFTVTNTGDNGGVNPAPGAGTGTLRQAIVDANAAAGFDQIDFNIPEGGAKTINLAAALPAITQAIFINGASQPGYNGQPIIAINGTSAGTVIAGLIINASSEIGGLVIQNMQGTFPSGNGIQTSTDAGETFIGNCYIGTNLAGAAAAANGGAGINIVGTSSMSIGSFSNLQRNVVSGNTSTGIHVTNAADFLSVTNNSIGTNVSEDAVIPNGGSGGVRFTGASSGDLNNNVISGNTGNGVTIDSNSNGVALSNNQIGTNASGTADLGNTQNGVSITGSTGTDVGLFTEGPEGNLISGNNSNGVLLNSGANSTDVRYNGIGINDAGAAAIANSAVGVVVSGVTTNVNITDNLISGNGSNGVEITASAVATVKSNFVGTNAAGTAAVANTGSGVVLNGASGCRVGGTTTADRNLISGNNSDGVAILSDGANNLVQGNYIGTDVNGTADLGNVLSGVRISNSNANTIGGTASGASNVISGNNEAGVTLSGDVSVNNLVQGNFIGTNATASAAIPNSVDGVNIGGAAANNTIGGTAAGARNIISGNTASGVFIGASSNSVQGNFIGTDGAGTGAIPNLNGIVVFSNATGNTVGGTTATARNIISGNSSNGILMQGSSVTGNLVQGNFIGTISSGLAALPNGIGITIDQGASTNTVGGTASGARNIISGNSGAGIVLQSTGTTGNSIQGNYIGLKADSSGALPNANGVSMQAGTTNNTVGGTAAGAGNVISGNSATGISINDSDVSGILIQGNLIGTDPTGATAIGNGTGINISQSSNNTIGGTSIAARNLISGNSGNGITIDFAENILMQGNYIGINAAGNAALGNGNVGVRIFSGDINAVGGATAGSGNVISGNGSHGVSMGDGKSSLAGNSVKGNFIGTNPAGTTAIANGGNGVLLNGTNSTTIGGTTANERNIISGNTSNGISLILGTTITQIQGNFIGTNATGTSAIANGTDGVRFDFNANNNTVGGTAAGTSNIIAFNTGRGVNVIDGTGNRVLGNSIFSNGSLGIDLGNNGITANDSGDGDSGPNNLQNFPVLTSAEVSGGNTTIMGTFNSNASESFRLEFFSSPTCDGSGNGEGQVFIGTTNVTTDGSGNATINVSLPVAVTIGQVVTATATRSSNNDTSEFSACRTVTMVSNNPPTITAAGPLSRQQGSPATNSQIATVSDPDQPANTLNVTATPGTGTGVTVTGIAIDASGNVTANVAASCTATNSTFTLTVTDNMSATAMATLVVNVTANTPPTLTYNNASVAFGGSTNVSPTANTDNGNITGYVIQSVVPPLNTPPTVNSSGVVSITNAAPAGNHVITVRATDNCGSTTDASFTLTVGAPPCAALPANGVSWYRAENNANDQLGINNGTLQNGATFAAGKVGQAFTLDGNDDRVLIGNPPSLQLQNFTIESWIKRASATLVTNNPFPGTVRGTFFAYGQDGYGFLITDTGRLELSRVGVTNVQSVATITDTAYHHVAVTKSGNTVIFYVDGVAGTPIAYNETFLFTTNAAIGARGDSDLRNAFFGDVDELTLYCRPLTAAEIQSIVAADVSGKCVPGTLSANLSVTKSDAPDPVLAGNNITYTVTVTNAGPHPAASVTLTDAVPANTTFVSITAPAGWNVVAPAVGGTGTITATNPGVASCAPQVFTIVVNVNIATPNGTVITNTASVSSTTSDPAPDNNNVSTTTTVNNNCSLTCPANITVSTAPNQCSAVVTYPAPGVSGSCGTVTCNPPSGSTFPKGTTVVTCTAQAGASCNFNITVNDTQAPTITCPGNISVIESPPGSGTAQVTYSQPTVSDNCPGVGTPNCTPASGSTFPIGTTTVNCTVTDAASNTANCSFQVTVSNACAITCPTTITVTAPSTQCSATVNYPAPTVIGNCGTVTCKPASGATFAVGTTRVNCTTTQGPSCSFNVIVLDRTQPQISCPSNVTVPVAGGQSGAVVNYPAPTVSDNCSGVLSFCTPASGATFPVGTTTVNCTATDNIGNSRSCAFTVTVLADTQPPVITCPQNVTVQAAAGDNSAVVTYPAPTVTDNNPGATAVCVPPSGSAFTLGTTPVTCMATDVGGNRASCTFSVTVQGGPPQGQVSIPGGRSNVEFPNSPVRRKPKPGGCSNFSITNIGQTPLILTFESIVRTGTDVTNGRITDPNEGDLYRLSRFNSNGTEIDVPFGGRVTIGVGETANFCARLVAVLPRVATNATGLAAPFVLPDVITSRATFRVSNGNTIVVNLLANLSTEFTFINLNNPKKPPQATFVRQGDNYVLTYGIFDPNLDVRSSRVELLDASGNTLATFDTDLQQPIRDRNLVRGQSFTVEQRFTGANDNPDVTTARVTVTDGLTSATLTASISSSTTALRGNGEGAVIVLPALRIRK